MVYTPPSYARSRAPLPVLYLYSGFDTACYFWTAEGRLTQILDNLLAEGKVVAMIVVMPDPHALPWEPTPMKDPGNFWANLSSFWAENQAAADEELFHDIIPFIQTHYNISDKPLERAIVGTSMGGIQALGTCFGVLMSAPATRD